MSAARAVVAAALALSWLSTEAAAGSAGSPQAQLRAVDRELSAADEKLAGLEEGVQRILKAAATTDRQVERECLARFSIERLFADLTTGRQAWTGPMKGLLSMPLEKYYEAKAYETGDMRHCGRLKRLPLYYSRGNRWGDDAQDCRDDYNLLGFLRAFVARSPDLAEICRRHFLMDYDRRELTPEAAASVCAGLARHPEDPGEISAALGPLRNKSDRPFSDLATFFKALNGDSSACESLAEGEGRSDCLGYANYSKAYRSGSVAPCADHDYCLALMGRADLAAARLERDIKAKFCSEYPVLNPRPTSAEAAVLCGREGAAVRNMLDAAHAKLARLEAAAPPFAGELYGDIDAREEKVARARERYARLAQSCGGLDS